MKYLKIAALIGTASITGCATGYNSWTPRAGTTVEAYQERSCASGYYECSIGSRGGSGDPGR